jgi:hypothetical protein
MKLSTVTQEILSDLQSAVRGIEPALGDRLAQVLPLASGTVSVRLLGLVTDLSAELSGVLPTGQVEVRLTSAETPELVYVAAEPAPIAPADDGEQARVTLRLPLGLKERAERAAEDAGLSLNSWIVNQLTDGLRSRPREAGHRLRGFGKA